MKSTKGKVITLLVVIGILIIGIGIAILLSNNKDMIEISNQVAKVQEFESNIDMTNVMSYYVDVSNYTVNNEKNSEIRYEYTDTTGDDKYDTCLVTIIPGGDIDTQLLDAGWHVVEKGAIDGDIVAISYEYKTKENLPPAYIPYFENPISIEINPWRIGEDVCRYDWSNNNSTPYDYATVSYKYIDTIGNGKWNACEVTISNVDMEKYTLYKNNSTCEFDSNNRYTISYRSNNHNQDTLLLVTKYGSQNAIQVDIDVNKIGENITELSMDKNATMIQGRSYQLNVKQESLGQEAKNLRWTSSNKNVAVVNQYGIVTAKGPGIATIKVEAVLNKKGAAENLEEGFEGGTATCTVTVTNDNSNQPYFSKTVTKDNIKYEYMDTSGDMRYDKCRVTVSNVTLDELPMGWEISSNAMYKDYGSNATEIIDVDPRDDWEKLITIEVDQIDTQVDIKNETTIQDTKNPGFTVEYRYINVDENNPVWEYCIVTIKTTDIVAPSGSTDGWIHDLDQGTYTKIFIKDGREDVVFRHATITISIDKIGKYTIPVENITLNKIKEEIKEGETTTLVATITPSNAVNKKISWSSSEQSVATVNENGVIRAVSEGVTVITAKAEGTNGEEVTAQCEVTVLPKLIGIEVTNKKIEYTHYDRLDLSELEVTAQYSNGDKGTITEGYTTSLTDGTVLTNGATLTETGDIPITVTYEGKTAQFTIKVVPKLIGLNIDLPYKIIYELGDTLNLEGLTATACYSNETEEEITDYTIEVEGGEELTEIGDKTITVTYKGLQVRFKINVVEEIVNPILHRLEITKPSKTEYEKGDKLDLTELKVYAVYTDGEKIKIENYTIDAENGEELTEVGNKTITIKYGDLEPVSFVITVKEKTDESGNQGGSGNQDENGDGSQGSTGTTSSSKVSNNGKGTNANTAPKTLPKTGIGETIRMYAIAFSIVMTIIGIIVIGSYVRYRKTPRE